IGAGMGAAAVLWVRANHMNRWTCRLLTLVGSAATATAIYLTESGDSAAQSGDMSRIHWFLTVGTFLLGGVLIHRLVLRLREYVQILDSIARTDTLTGVPNRRAWDEALPPELDRCRREGRTVCVAMIDIDHFKAFNDSRGHQEGDVLLRRAATAWQGQLREEDLLARYGGEEFAVVLRDCTLPDAAMVLERLREATPDGQTCSVGLAAWDGRETPLQLVSRADDALYTSKKHGRDRLTVAEWNHTAPPPPSGWVVAVRELIDANAVMTAYQPIVDLRSDGALGYEALARTSGRSTGVPIGEVFANARRCARPGASPPARCSSSTSAWRRCSTRSTRSTRCCSCSTTTRCRPSAWCSRSPSATTSPTATASAPCSPTTAATASASPSTTSATVAPRWRRW